MNIRFSDIPKTPREQLDFVLRRKRALLDAVAHVARIRRQADLLRLGKRAGIVPRRPVKVRIVKPGEAQRRPKVG